MPKAYRYFERGYHYHLTHRCHNREFLLKFARDLDVYREMMRVRSRTWRTPILGYSLTSNHVHLLVTATNSARISEFMNALQGDFAQYYNRRKKRTGSFWAGRFHATAVGSETYISTLSERIKNRRELAAFPLPDTSDRLNTWIVRETRGKYA